MSPEQAQSLQAVQPRLVRFFAARVTDSFVRDDLVGRVNERIVRLAAEGSQIDDVERFVFGVAKHVLHEHWRSVKRQKESEVTLSATVENLGRSLTSTAVTGAFSRTATLAALKDCLLQLPETDQLIAQRCYGDGKSKDNRAALSTELGITRNTLDARLTRMRSKLEECVKRSLVGRGKP